MQGSGPNVVIMLADDMGFSDIGAYGGEIDTPHLDALAQNGTMFSRFYNTARCSTSRASLLTGLHPQQSGIGILTQDDGPAGYPGTLNDRCATLAEILGDDGYRTHLSGKWHLATERSAPSAGWPTRRGFHTFFGTLTGCGSYFDPGTLMRGEAPAEDAEDPGFFYTDAIGADAAAFVTSQDPGRPFFLYAAFTAPHWPLHATAEDLEIHRGRFDAGWDVLRAKRLERQKQLGVIPDVSVALSDRDPEVPAWEDIADQAWQITRMEAYAAMVHALDRNVGRILHALDESGHRENTIIVFLSDNGASYEELPFEGSGAEYHRTRHENFPGQTRDGREIAIGNHPSIIPGPEDTYASYGRAWANVSNTPYRMYKEWVHEGGIATPFILSWEGGGVNGGEIEHAPLQLVDVLPTILELTGITYPRSRAGRDLVPLPGVSFAPALHGEESEEHTLYWEHLGNCAIREAGWKLVREFGGEWELYEVEADPTERQDVARQHPDRVSDLAAKWEAWAERSGVRPFADIVESYMQRGLTLLHAKGS